MINDIFFIFFKIIANDDEKKHLNLLKDRFEIYNLFCKHGYKKTFDDFKIEIHEFLNFVNSLKVSNKNFDEISDDILESVSGGINKKKAVKSSINSLLTTFNLDSKINIKSTTLSNYLESPSIYNCFNKFENYYKDIMKSLWEIKTKVVKLKKNITDYVNGLPDTSTYNQREKDRRSSELTKLLSEIENKIDLIYNLENIDNLKLLKNLATKLRLIKDICIANTNVKFIDVKLKFQHEKYTNIRFKQYIDLFSKVSNQLNEILYIAK